MKLPSLCTVLVFISACASTQTPEETADSGAQKTETPETTSSPENAEAGQTSESPTKDSDSKKAATPEEPPDRIELKDGSVIVGTVVDMKGGTLYVKTAFGAQDTVGIKWDQVAKIETAGHHTLEIKDKKDESKEDEEDEIEVKAIKGKIVRTEDGTAVVVVEGEQEIPLDTIQAINPPPDNKLITLAGNLNFGASAADGNTQAKNLNVNGEAVARSDPHRVTVRFTFNYSEDSDNITADSQSGNVKYDLFLIERLYANTGILLQADEFQDLNLRAAPSVGLGYQFIDKGDFEKDWNKNLQVALEAGYAYFREDFIMAEDVSRNSAHVATNLNWPFFSGKLALFHVGGVYPSPENGSDIFLTTEQGLRVKVWGNLVSTFQINWKWNNNPAPGTERNDALYLITLGYQFDF